MVKVSEQIKNYSEHVIHTVHSDDYIKAVNSLLK